MTSQHNDLVNSKLSSTDNQQSPVAAPSQLIFLIADFPFKMWSSKQIDLQRVRAVKLVSLFKWFCSVFPVTAVCLYTTMSEVFWDNQNEMGALGLFSFPLIWYSEFEECHLGLDL